MLLVFGWGGCEMVGEGSRQGWPAGESWLSPVRRRGWIAECRARQTDLGILHFERITSAGAHGVFTKILLASAEVLLAELDTSDCIVVIPRNSYVARK